MAHNTVHVSNLSWNMASYSPAQTIELISRAGAKKGRMRPDKIFMSAASSGCIASFASGASLIATANPWYIENAPGITKMIGGLLFPTGIVMILLTGGELFTGSTMITGISFLHSRLSLKRMLMHWALCFFGNLAGALFVMAVVLGYGGVFDQSPIKEQAITMASNKVLGLEWHQIFLRGIGCNWLVCMSCFLGLQAKDLTSKVMGMWWPIFVFVTLGLEHVVANMFFIPVGIFLGAPGLSVGLYIWKSMIPTLIGNILGGGGFCGAFYYYLHVLGEPDILLDGTYYERLEEGTLMRTSTIVEETAMEKECPSGTDSGREDTISKVE